MSVHFGVHPGGKNKFAVSGLYWNGHAPATVFHFRSHSGADEVLKDIIGLYGEWSAIDCVAIDAPLSWSGSPSGWRDCDLQLRSSLPTWVPRTWIRPPNALPGAISVQGPALTWALAREAKQGSLPEHPVVETNPRLSLAYLAPDLRESILGYRRRGSTVATISGHVTKILQRLVESGLVRVDVPPPKSAEELDALVCGLLALAKAEPQCGLPVGEWAGGDIRPVGRRQVAILRGLP